MCAHIAKAGGRSCAGTSMEFAMSTRRGLLIFLALAGAGAAAGSMAALAEVRTVAQSPAPATPERLARISQTIIGDGPS
jgi:hypothetical protein